LKGRPLSDLVDGDTPLAIPEKLLSAFRNAATYIQDKDKPAEGAATDNAPRQSIAATRRERVA
jgi:hypothetical protein